MTPKIKRLRALLSGESVDRVLCMPIIIGYNARIMNISIGDYYRYPKERLKSQLLAAEMHGFDLLPGYTTTSFGTWEFGGEIEFPYREGLQAPMVKKYPIETPEDVDKLEVPDVKKAGWVPMMLEFARKAVKLGYPATLRGGTPFAMAGKLMGVEKLMRWIIKEPNLVHKVLRKATDYLIDLFDLFTDEFSVVIPQDSSPTSSNVLISGKKFEKFAFPYVKELHKKGLSLGVSQFYTHICGLHDKNLKYWRMIPYGKTGRPGIVSVGDETDLTVAKELFGKDNIIMGNVNTLTTLSGSYDEVLGLCRECIKKGKDNPMGYILSSACEVPPDSPPMNLHAYRKAVELYGVYD